jgi:multidrug efflux pump subunit AcrB
VRRVSSRAARNGSKPFVLQSRIDLGFARLCADRLPVSARHWYVMVVTFIAGCLGVVHYFRITPTAFIPNEDQGYYFVHYQLPPGASRLRTQDVSNRIQAIARRRSAVTDAIRNQRLELPDKLAFIERGHRDRDAERMDERNVKQRICVRSSCARCHS